MKDNGAETIKIELDENGHQFTWKEVIKRIPRKTFLLGKLQGKYWGEIDDSKESFSGRYRMYDFQIYEALVELNTIEPCSCIGNQKLYCNGLHKEEEGPFITKQGFTFPLGRLPETLVCSISIDKQGSQLYNVVLRDIRFINVEIDRLLHQSEDNEVFGFLTSTITGYILDFKEQSSLEKEYIKEEIDTPSAPTVYVPQLRKTLIETGETEESGNYRRKEFYYDDYQNTYWSPWKKQESKDTAWVTGCSDSIFNLVGIIFIVAFIILVLPQAIWFVIAFGALYLFSQFPTIIWKIIFAGMGFVLLFGFILTLISIFSRGSDYVNNDRLSSTDDKDKKKVQMTIVPINSNNSISPDTIYTISRNWTDWNNNNYAGNYQIKRSDLQTSIQNKLNLDLNPVNELIYDELLDTIINHDSFLMPGVIEMLDSIIDDNQLNKAASADMIISFVQDFQFALLLPSYCDPDLYNEVFIKEWLNDPSIICKENEKFGLYTPIEFIFYQQGDCDSRTTLLYTLLTHFGIDACILSSESYHHSLIGVNLPYNGIKYIDGNSQYVVWETTESGMPPGILPVSIFDLDYWRISLKPN